MDLDVTILLIVFCILVSKKLLDTLSVNMMISLLKNRVSSVILVSETTVYMRCYTLSHPQAMRKFKKTF